MESIGPIESVDGLNDRLPIYKHSTNFKTSTSKSESDQDEADGQYEISNKKVNQTTNQLGPNRRMIRRLIPES